MLWIAQNGKCCNAVSGVVCSVASCVDRGIDNLRIVTSIKHAQTVFPKGSYMSNIHLPESTVMQPPGVNSSCVTGWKGTQWVRCLTPCLASSGEMANLLHKEAAFWQYREWLLRACIKPDYMAAGKQSRDPETKVWLIHYLQPMAEGDLSVTKYDKHSESSGS